MPKRYAIDATEQLFLPFGPIRNSELFSNHWLEKRLPLEPEWTERRESAADALEAIKKVWAEERSRVELYGNEQSLEYGLIQPVFESLGWKLIYQTRLRGRKPDYALFLDDEAKAAALAAGTDLPDFWRFPALLADAKAWHIRLDRPATVNNQREYPPEQVEWYLSNSQLDYAILTNGQTWRLMPRKHNPDQPRFQTYLECDLPTLLTDLEKADLAQQESVFGQFFRFFLFFGPAAHQSVATRTPLIERARQGSSEYRLGIGKDLRMRVFEALRLCIEGFLKYGSNNLDPAVDLSRCREQSFILLYRILFTIYAEDRQLLPYHINKLYTDNRSLGRFRDEIAAILDRSGRPGAKDYAHDSIQIWDDLALLFDLINSGRKSYGVPAYNGGLFDPSNNEFLAAKKMSDWYLARVIDQLGRAADEDHLDSGLYRVDYRDLQIQHLGNIYEGLMELHPNIATETMVIIRPRARSRHMEESTVKANLPLPKGYETIGVVYPLGGVYLVNEKGERRASGSYYTPNHIVEYIVEQTLRPLCEGVDKRLRQEIAETEEALRSAEAEERSTLEEKLGSLKSDYDDRILALRVLDPAMGSGHFLLRACQYLAEEIATHPYSADSGYETLQSSESALTYWKRKIVERCLYGVDLNPLAVELAKLALWLETVSRVQPLTFLDHHLRHGNSLVGAFVSQLGTLPKYGVLLENAFSRQVHESLPAMLEPLASIRATPSDNTDQVKDKEQQYRKTFVKLKRPFRELGDLWCSTFYLADGSCTPDRYQQALDALPKPDRFAKLSKQEWFKAGIDRAQQSDTAFFHWQLEFPDAFFHGRDDRTDAGFDAVIGNPPYDVLSEKESGHDMSGLKAFIEAQPVYDPSRRGKNNLYKLFVCRAMQLLADGGRMGFIVPMPILGDDQAVGIRQMILKQGAFTGVETFPQKDDPRRRVFPEAKLSTTIVTCLRTSQDTVKGQPFVSRVHPANVVEEESPNLRLTTSEIPLYDASNLSIVSCSQSDWDLAVRVMQSGRMARLSQSCTQFQGEVNETNEKANGCLSCDKSDGPLVLRGSNVCLYVLRDASQGEDLYLRASKFLTGKSELSKAFHSGLWRLGFQRSSPQNNFRRIVAALVPPDNFCFDTVSYVPSSHTKLPLELLLGLLNSKLLDWYFRLGSTNSKVNEYQFDNLPCPIFAKKQTPTDGKTLATALKALAERDTEQVSELLAPALRDAPFSPIVQEVIVEAVKRITDIEHKRDIGSRTERSALHPDAQIYQDLIDRLLYRMAGLTHTEAQGLEERLSHML